MADELTQPPAPAAPTPKAAPQVVSLRMKNQAEAARFAKVLAWRIEKGKSGSVSEFMWQMFQYIENNPYSDFPTGR